MIANWKIYALEHPMPVDFEMGEFRDIGIDPHDLWFTPVYEDGRVLDLIVYSSTYRWEIGNVFRDAVRRVLWNLLGERSFALDIGEVEVDNLSCLPEGVEVMRLEELPDYFGSRESVFVVDAKVRIMERVDRLFEE